MYINLTIEEIEYVEYMLSRNPSINSNLRDSLKDKIESVIETYRQNIDGNNTQLGSPRKPTYQCLNSY